MKSKLATIGIIVVTIILAGVAIFTAKRLYDTRDQAVAPNVPSSKPAAAGELCGGIQGLGCPTGEVCVYSNGRIVPSNPDETGTCQVRGEHGALCQLSFSIASPSPSPTPTPTRSPSPSPTASPVPLCNSVCNETSDCPSSMICHIPSGSTAGNCRNTSCTSATNCVCATATPSPTPTRTPSPTPVVTITPSSSPVAQCNSACTSNSQCTGSMICYIPSGQTAGNCRNSQCLTETDCTCAVAVVTTPPAEPTLPVVGTSWPTIVGSVFGVIVILGSLLLAL